MDWKEFLFGRPSKINEIEGDWNMAKQSIRCRLEEQLRPLELERDKLAGIAESEAIPFNVRLKRLNDVEKQMSDINDEAAEEEDAAWFKRMKALKEDEMASANVFRRFALWLYWHA